MSDDLQNSVLLSTFYSRRKRYRLYFHRNQIVWDNEKPPYAQHTLPIENVIAVGYKYLDSGPAEDRCYDPHYFTIHYAEKKEINLWCYNSLTLRHSDTYQVSSWVKTLQNHLQSFCKRPKKLLLFVNPYGGKRKAMKVFEKYGKPLFNIAGVDVSVIVSQRQNQIRDILIHHNLDMFDSVACVGGDGTVSELFNGLVIRECKLQGINPDESKQSLPKPTLPIGIIPGGSTDTIVYSLHGTTDITTAVLHIILGDSLGLDLVSVHDEDRLLRLFASALSYGYLGDVAYNSESLRWMGPSRYDYCGFKKIMANRGYKGEIAILSDGLQVDQLKCYEKCEKCISKQFDNHNLNKSENEWKTVQGKFFMVSAANISCACKRSPSGIAPYCHIGDGYLHLIVIHHTSLFNNLRILSRYAKSTYTIDDLPFIEVYRAKEICFRAIDTTKSRWNCDGEVQHQSDIRARVHCQLLTVFSRGSSIPDESNKSCNFCKF
ncbi:hypothetical protein RN001_015748 [Aquatica leii]|uniref:Ceramide kinase n=1 Tax=Aquatica leii TaxID=1421715 RepID=A0AAN7PME0_9COLE|nr:hypothetical protein RN001_015748 [Aquatica leii]